MAGEISTLVPEFVNEFKDGSRLVVAKGTEATAGARAVAETRPNIGFCSKTARDILVGHQPWIVARELIGRRDIVGIGTSATGLVGCSLNFSLFCNLGGIDFWKSLRLFADRIAATQLLVEQFHGAEIGGSGARIPVLGGEFQRYSDIKLYIWQLARDDWDKGLSSNHRRNINRARREGVELVSLPPAEAFDAHLRLIGASLKRRTTRGEPTNLASDEREVREILGSGHAELFQAAIAGEIVSSKIVYSLGPFAFYDSGGTSQKGMAIGASHLLMYSIASALRGRGIVSLDLDVASAAAGGLARYKADFGAEEWRVERVRCDLRSPGKAMRNAWRTAASRLVQGFRRRES